MRTNLRSFQKKNKKQTIKGISFNLKSRKYYAIISFKEAIKSTTPNTLFIVALEYNLLPK